MKLFNHLDLNRNGQISRNEIYDFMSKQFLNPRIVDSEDIVREYDGTQNDDAKGKYQHSITTQI